MEYELDAHGVSVIDAQNNGRPDTFAVLARALGIPWLAVFDGDDGGERYITAISRRGFTQQETTRRCRTHGAGDLEAQLVTDGLGPGLRDILTELGIRDAADMTDDEFLKKLRANKTDYAALLAADLRDDPDLAQRAPEAFRNAIEQLPGLT